jgi:hypothetical protein
MWFSTKTLDAFPTVPMHRLTTCSAHLLIDVLVYTKRTVAIKVQSGHMKCIPFYFNIAHVFYIMYVHISFMMIRFFFVFFRNAIRFENVYGHCKCRPTYLKLVTRYHSIKTGTTLFTQNRRQTQYAPTLTGLQQTKEDRSDRMLHLPAQPDLEWSSGHISYRAR